MKFAKNVATKAQKKVVGGELREREKREENNPQISQIHADENGLLQPEKKQKNIATKIIIATNWHE